MPDDLTPTTPQPTEPERRTWAGNKPLDTRWWWSASLMIVVGLVVIGYQAKVLMAGTGIALNWVMVVIGAVVVGWGVVDLIKDARARRVETGGPAS
ncbi:MAG: hypothetical protein HGA44_16305 [Cellulomonadaceae bacterium]|nr:hypothetical protein [Cellulomonadaceae bacterium]